MGGDFTQCSQKRQYPVGQSFVHEIEDVAGSGMGDIFAGIKLVFRIVLSLPGQNVQQVGSGDHADNDIPVHNRQYPLLIFDNFLLNLRHIRIRCDPGHVCGHVIPNRHRVELMKKGFFNDLAGDETQQIVFTVRCFRNHQCIDVVAGQQIGRFLAGHICSDSDGRGRHDILGLPSGPYFAVKNFQKAMLHLGQGLFLQCGRCRITVPATTQKCYDGADIYFGNPASGHDMNLVFHAGNGENGVQILHLDEFVNQYGKIRNVIIADDTGQDDVDAVDHVMCCRLDHIVQQADLLGADFSGDHRGNGIEIGALGQQKCGGGKIIFSCGGKGKRTSVFVNPQAENGGLVRRDIDFFFPENICQDGDGGAGQSADAVISLDIGDHGRMVIINMNFDILSVDNG